MHAMRVAAARRVDRDASSRQIRFGTAAGERAMGDLTSGLTTRIDRNGDAARLLIESVAWTSPFRGTGVEVGDEVVAVDGRAFDATATGMAVARLAGQYAESQGFDAAGRKPGDPLRLTLARRDAGTETRFEASAPLAERRDWRNADNRVLVGPGGPDYLSNDGFVDSWTGWAEKFKRRVDGLLDVARRSASFDGTSEASEFSGRHGERVAYAVEHYPGPWSAAVKYDYDRVLALTRPPPPPPPPPESVLPAAPPAAALPDAAAAPPPVMPPKPI